MSNLTNPTESAKKMFLSVYPRPVMADQFIEKLFKLYQCEFSSDMEDYACCINALMASQAVNWKSVEHLHYDSSITCQDRYNGDVEDYFFSTINTEAHAKDFNLFKAVVEDCFDFHNSLLVSRRTTLNNLAAQFGKLKNILVTKTAS